jgi:hypothetical protein
MHEDDRRSRLIVDAYWRVDVHDAPPTPRRLGNVKHERLEKRRFGHLPDGIRHG